MTFLEEIDKLIAECEKKERSLLCKGMVIASENQQYRIKAYQKAKEIYIKTEAKGFENVILHQGDIIGTDSLEVANQKLKLQLDVFNKCQSIDNQITETFLKGLENEKFVNQIMEQEKKDEIATKERVYNFVIETIKKHLE